MKIYITIISLFVFLIITSCSDSARVVEKQLNLAETMMIENPDSAQCLLNAIDRSKLRSRRNKARYALQMSRALDKNYIDVADDSLIRVAVNYYGKYGSAEERAMTYYYDAIIKGNAQDSDAAIESLVKAREYAQKTSNHYLRGLIDAYFGSLYYEQYSFEESVKAYSQAIDAFNEIGCKKNMLSVLYNQGLAQNMAERYDEAMETLSAAKDIALELGDTVTVLDIMNSMCGTILVNRLDSLSIRSCERILMNMYEQTTNGHVPPTHYTTVGYICFQNGQLDSARTLYNKYYNQCPNITSLNIGVLNMLSQIESALGNYKAAWEYQRLFSQYTDSIHANWRNTLVQNLERKYKTEYLQKSYDALQKSQRYATISWILFFAFIVFAGAILLNNYRKALKRKNLQIVEYQSYIEEGQNLYAELTEKYDMVRKNAAARDERSQALFTLLGNRLHSLKQLLEWASVYEKNTDSFYRHFKDHIKVASGNNKELAEDVIAIADLTCGGIITRLHEMHPDLSRHELSYCGFVCLGFSPESIRILYNHTNTYSIYTMRSKIRNKMGITNNTCNLETYIKNLTTDPHEPQ